MSDHVIDRPHPTLLELGFDLIAETDRSPTLEIRKRFPSNVNRKFAKVWERPSKFRGLSPHVVGPSQPSSLAQTRLQCGHLRKEVIPALLWKPSAKVRTSNNV